ncbi:MFS transporter [Actinokineospora cianjurensis]|uniref:MFS transporter n=1 Tax=Actinokineospora cianjurensis TaxID=585224 RepID=UPI001B8751FD|nr:MFS transporter [Actinokineospora cianjurensis]
MELKTWPAGSRRRTISAQAVRTPREAAITENPVVDAVPLSRNRGYHVLWSSMLLAELASEVAYIALPLLVLAHGGSAAQVAAVAAVLAGTRMACGVPAGVLADRCDRRVLMLVAQGARALAMVGMVVTLATGAYSFAVVLVVAAVEGVGGSVFQPAEHAALPQVVPVSQLSDALARNAARPFAAVLIGPVLAGATFALHQVWPFSIEAAVLALSFAVLLTLRLPRVAVVSTEPERRSVAGFRWLLRQPLLRATALWLFAVNLGFHALVVTVLIVSGVDGVGYGEIGLTMACLGVGGLVGSLAAGPVHAAVRPGVIVVGASWVFAVVVGMMSVVPAGLSLGVLLGVAAAFFPIAGTTVMTYQLTSVPDELRGRLSGVVGLCTDLAGTAGPLVGGLLITVTGSARTGIPACAVLLAVAAVGASLSPTLRRFPKTPSGRRNPP